MCITFQWPSRGTGLFLEREHKLFPEPFRDLVALHAVSGGPSAGRHVIGSKQAVDPWEMDGKINIDGFFFNTVMPMVKAGRDDERLQPFNVESDIGVDVGR